MHWGLDGARGGWILAGFDYNRKSAAEVYFCQSLEQVGSITKSEYVSIDMPIGLAKATQPRREWEAWARGILKGRLSSRVFTPPIQEVLSCETYHEANALSKELCGLGVSKQAWNIAPKIRELASWLAEHPSYPQLWRERHPEIAFARLNLGAPVVASKRTAEGLAIRLKILARAGIDAANLWKVLQSQEGSGLFAKDDVLDALALAATPELFHETISA